MLHYLSFSLFVIGSLIDTVKVPDPKGALADTTSTTSVIAYHPHKHMAAMTTFLQHQPITIMMGTHNACKCIQKVTWVVFHSPKQS